jgi:hypothetical protein
MRPVRFDDEAAEELAAAALWYDEQNPGIGTKLTQATREAARRIWPSRQAHSVSILVYPIDSGFAAALWDASPTR